MSYAWNMPEIAPEKDVKKLSPWLWVALFVLIHIVGVTWRLMVWPTGKAVDHSFWLGLLLPAIAWAMLCCLILAYRDVNQKMVTCWNVQRQRYAAYRQQWAQQHWVVAEVATVTPEPALAERLLGLEDNPPEHAGKTLPLTFSEDNKQDRMTQLLTQLLTPLAASIRSVSKIKAPRIYLQGGSPDDEIVLDRLWEKLQLPVHGGVVRGKPEASLLRRSQEEGLAPVSVVLSCQLWKGDEDASMYSELGAGLVVIAPEIADQLKIQVRTMLLRPIEAMPEQVEQTLTTLAQGRQTEWARLKHVWISRLDKPAHHAVCTALQDMASKTALHDLDKAIGKPGVANAWLLQALAAQMVKHGQGDQMVVCAQARHAMTWNMVSAKLLPPSPVDKPDMGMLSGYFLGALVFLCAAIGCLLEMQNAPLANILPTLAGFLCIFVSVQIISTVFVLRNVEKQFWQKTLL